MSAADFSWSPHACDRWAERFAGIDWQQELSSAKRIGKKQRRRIRIQCPVNAARWMQGGFAGRYYLLGRSNVVFVIAAPDTVLTVFHLSAEDGKVGTAVPTC